MSLGSEPAWAAPLGVARVLSVRAVPPLGCECLRVLLRSLRSKTMRMMMMRRKMTQPAPMAAKRAGLEPKIPSTEPGLLSWFLVPERKKEQTL